MRRAVTETCHHRSVLRHIVLFSFKDEVPLAERAAILDDLRGLRSSVPSLRSLEVAENISPAAAQGYTHVLHGTFDDRVGLEAYLTHPAHVAVAARTRAATAQVLVVDLEG